MHAKVVDIAAAFIQSKALYSAAKLGVADVLEGGPLPVR